MDVNDYSKFWKHIFEEEGLALCMSDIAGNSAGLSFHSPIHKQVKLTASPASALGDNFLSTVYLVQAVLENETTYRSFVKVDLGNFFYMKHTLKGFFFSIFRLCLV